MALVFQYLDPSTYDIESRSKELADLYNPTGFDPSIILVSGALDIQGIPWVIPVTYDLITMAQDYIGGPNWESSKNPNLTDSRYRTNWNQVWTIESPKLAKKLSEYGFIYPYVNRLGSFIYPALKNSNTANNPLTDLFSGFAVSDIVQRAYEINLIYSGQAIAEPKRIRESVDLLQQYIDKRFDRRYIYKVDVGRYSNGVGFYHIDLSSFDLRFVNLFSIRA